MPRLMSVSMTEASVRSRRKTVTRRLGWTFLKPGDRLTLCRKVMGRKPGEPLERIATVEVTHVRRERLVDMTDADVALEAVPESDLDLQLFDDNRPSRQWVRWFAARMGISPTRYVTRIEWRYLDEAAA